MNTKIIKEESPYSEAYWKTQGHFTLDLLRKNPIVYPRG